MGGGTLIYGVWSRNMSSSSSKDKTVATEPHRLKKAFAIIALGLQDNYLHHISDLEDPTEAWATLDHLFGASNKHSRFEKEEKSGRRERARDMKVEKKYVLLAKARPRPTAKGSDGGFIRRE